MVFRQSFSFCFLLCFFALSSAFAEKDDSENISEVSPELKMGYADATVFGLVEGITEFLPISSTGHLILFSEILGKEEGNKDYEDAIYAYLIVIQAGAIFAVALIYRKELWSIALGFLGLDPRGRRLGVNLMLAFLPAAALGPLLDNAIESLLFGLLPVAFALFAGGLFMLWAERKKNYGGFNPSGNAEKALDDITWKNAIFIGFMQCVAMCPGTSRSMMTIVAGYMIGLARDKAAEFSFLLGLITLTAAAAYKCLTKWEVMTVHLHLGPIAWGCLVAGISAALSVFWLLGYLSRRGLGIFVWYRIILSLVILFFYFY